MRIKLLIFVVIFLGSSAYAAQPGKTLPFTRAQNQDGSKFVWFIYGNKNLSYDYVPAKDLPKSPHFTSVSETQPGDVAWWPGYVAITRSCEGKKCEYITAEYEINTELLEFLYGEPKFYRYLEFKKAP